MNIRYFLIVAFIGLGHLPFQAGAFFKIAGNRLKPTIEICLSKDEQHLIESDVNNIAKQILSLHMFVNSIPSELSVAGYYRLRNDTLTYSPMYPLQEGRIYEIRHYKNAIIMHKEELFIKMPPVEESTTEVVQIYPMTDTIPINTLFFHVRFSQPMQKNVSAYTSIFIQDENGIDIKDTWRQRSYWLDSNRLLVLMIHPGRVKTGIHYSHPVFQKGKHYKITVKQEIRDNRQNPIKANAEKHYFTTSEDRKSPGILSISPVTTRDSVLIKFSEGIDHASIFKGIKLTSFDKRDKHYYIEYGKTDNEFWIICKKPLPKGRYKISFSNTVSDFAANRLNRTFEVKRQKTMRKDLNNVVKTFRVR